MRNYLLAPDEPPAVTEIRRDGQSNIVILVDHASQRIPRRLRRLGLPESELARHIAWDIGSLGVASRLSELLDATLVAQNYSRLVIDCNRDPASETSIPVVGEHTPIPGNENLSADDRDARLNEIFTPYHAHIEALLDERQRHGRKTILVAQHSMTDIFKGLRRDMQAAVMYNRDARLGIAVRRALSRDAALTVADNEPYAMTDATDFTLPRHGEGRGLLHVGIEIRQDLVTDAAGQEEWAQRLAEALVEAME